MLAGATGSGSGLGIDAVTDSDGGTGPGAGVRGGGTVRGGRDVRRVRLGVGAAPQASPGVGVAASAASAASTTGSVMTAGACASGGSRIDGIASAMPSDSESDAKQYYYFKHRNDLCVSIEGTEDRLQVIIMEYKPSINVAAADEQRDKYVCVLLTT